MGLFGDVTSDLKTNVSWDNQKLSNIQWINQTPETLAWRFPDPDQVLQNNSTVIVSPGQAMLFVNEGIPQGVVTQPGSIDIQTANTPFLTSLLSIFRGFDSKHKGKIFFFNVNKIPNVKWGTPSPLKYLDPVYKFPVGLRAFGNYTFTITDPMKFFSSFVGDRDIMTLEEFKESINARIITPITDTLASARFSFVEIDSNREELSTQISAKISAEFAAFGFTMDDFRIENTDFDEATQKLVATVSAAQAQAAAMNSLSGVNQAGFDNYAKLQQLEALKTAAANEGGVAGAAVTVGAGVGLGAAMAGAFTQPVAPTPVPVAQTFQAPIITPQPVVVTPVTPVTPVVETPISPVETLVTPVASPATPETLVTPTDITQIK